MSRAVMQQALEALEEAHWKIEHKQDAVKRGQTIAALKQALAEPEQPLEYVRDENNPCYMFTALTTQPEQEPQTTHWEGCEAVHPECKAAPTPRKPLTDEEIQFLSWYLEAEREYEQHTGQETLVVNGYLSFARAVIAAYEDKNGIGEQHE